MVVQVISRTFLDEIGHHSAFPTVLRDAVIQSVHMISATEFQEACRRREGEEGNFDDLIAKRLADLLPASAVLDTCKPVSRAVSFKNDIEIRTPTECVSIEIEKRIRGRFELDLEKMRAFARQHAGKRCFGAMIVPADNTLPRDVTGRSGESSYDYVRRVGRLFLETEHGNLEDILVVGYHMGQSRVEGTSVHLKERGRSGARFTEGSWPTHLVDFADTLRHRPTLRDAVLRSDALKRLHDALYVRVPSLHEKWNSGANPYLGFAGSEGRADALYIYVQVGGLVLDVRMARREETLFQNLGFSVRYRDNFQGQAGWVTGVRIPHQTQGGDFDSLIQVLADTLYPWS